MLPRKVVSYLGHVARPPQLRILHLQTAATPRVGRHAPPRNDLVLSIPQSDQHAQRARIATAGGRAACGKAESRDKDVEMGGGATAEGGVKRRRVSSREGGGSRGCQAKSRVGEQAARAVSSEEYFNMADVRVRVRTYSRRHETRRSSRYASGVV